MRFNIFWHEVLNIHKAEEFDSISEKWAVMIFIDSRYIDNTIERKLERQIPKLKFDKDFRYARGLESQLAVKLPVSSYFDLVSDEHIFEGIRQYNFQLSCKGKIVHKGHNYELVRTLLEKKQ